jgi:hypothetical protein
MPVDGCTAGKVPAHFGGSGATIVALGYANFIIPYANVFGRRPAMLVCCIIVLGSNIRQVTATSYESFLGARDWALLHTRVS